MKINATNIYFLNPTWDTTREDSVQFDTQDDKDLAELWFSFCQDEGIITEVCKGTADYDTGIMIE